MLKFEIIHTVSYDVVHSVTMDDVNFQDMRRMMRDMVRNWAKNLDTDEELVPSFSEIDSHIPSGCGEYIAEISGIDSGSQWDAIDFYLVHPETP